MQFTAEVSAQQAKCMQDVLENSLLIGLISEYITSSFVLDGVCRGIKEARFGVAQFSLTNHGSKEYVGSILFHLKMHKRMNPKKQLRLNLHYEYHEYDSPREYFDHITDRRLDSECLQLMADVREVSLQLNEFAAMDLFSWAKACETVTALRISEFRESRYKFKPFSNVMKNLVSFEAVDWGTPFNAASLVGSKGLKNLKLDAYIQESAVIPLDLDLLESIDLVGFPSNNPFGRLPALRELSIGELSQTDLNFVVSQCPRLRSISCEKVNATDLTPLCNLKHLTFLAVNAEAVLMLPQEIQLRTLEIQGGIIDSDAEVIGKKLASMPYLRGLHLECRFNQAVAVLEHVKNLKRLGIYNSFDNLDFLVNLPHLEYLNLSGYRGKDITALGECKNLNHLIFMKYHEPKASELESLLTKLPGLCVQYAPFTR